MRAKRFLALALAGFLTIGSINTGSVKAYASDFDADYSVEETLLAEDFGDGDVESPEVADEQEPGGEETAPVTEADEQVVEPVLIEDNEQIVSDEQIVFSEEQELVEEEISVEAGEPEYKIAEPVLTSAPAPEEGQLVLDGNGGTFINAYGDDKSYEIIYDYGDNEYDRNIDEREYIVERDGYAFTGWYADPECTQLVSDTSYSYLRLSTQVKAGTTVYAGWTEDFYTVILDGNNGGQLYDREWWYTEEPENKFYDGLSDTKNVLVPKGGLFRNYDLLGWQGRVLPKEKNMMFKVWSTDAEGKNTISSTYSFKPTDDCTLYAQYDVSFTVTFYAKDGKFANTYYNKGELNDECDKLVLTLLKDTWLGTYYTGSGAYVYLPSAPRANDSGSVFLTWCTDEECNNPITMKDLENTVLVKDLVFYAKYTKGYTVTFDFGIGSYEGNSSISYGPFLPGTSVSTAKVSVPQSPVAEGKVFEGWYLDDKFTQKVSENEILATCLNSDVTFYANYAEAVNVTFHANGGSFEGSAEETVTVVVAKNNIVGGKAPVVSGKDGKAFTGWYTDAACNTEAVNIYKNVYAKDTDLYAGFENDGYFTVTFKTGREDAKFLNGKDTVEIKVKKGEPLYYGESGETPRTNTSPKINFTSDLKSKKVIPTQRWKGSDGNFWIFSSMGGVYNITPSFEPDDGNPEYTGTSIYGTNYVPSGDITFTAEWAPMVTLTLDTKDVMISIYSMVAGKYIALENDPFVEIGSDSTKIYLHKGASYGAVSLPSVYKRVEGVSVSYSWGYDSNGNKLSLRTLNDDVTIYAKASEGSSTKYHSVKMHLGAGKMASRNYNISHPYGQVNYVSEFSYQVAEFPSRNVYNSQILIDDPTLAFAGWYKDEALTQPYGEYLYSSGGLYCRFTEEVTDLYAKYDKAINVTFDANGGFFDNEGNTYTVDEKVLSNSEVVAKVSAGYKVNMSSYAERIRNSGNKVFAGWYFDEACTQKIDTAFEDSYNEYIGPEKDIRVYAKWINYSTEEDKTLTLSGDTSIEIGETGKLSLTVGKALKDAKVNFRAVNVTYGESNTGYAVPAVIDSEGNVKAVAEGTISFYAVANGVYSNTITVNIKKPVEIEVCEKAEFTDESGSVIADKSKVENGYLITLSTATQNAKIKYVAEYTNSHLDFLDITADDVLSSPNAQDYSLPIEVNIEDATGKMRIAAVVQKEGAKDSELSVLELVVDNTGIFDTLGIDDRDKDLFDFRTVTTSGLVISKLDLSDMVYTGSPLTLADDEIRVYYNGLRLKNYTDYKVTYKNNTKAGNASLTIALMGNYEGTRNYNFEIKKRPITDTILASSYSYIFSDKDKTIAPVPTLKFTDYETGKTVTLKKGTDFDVFYNPVSTSGVDYSKELDGKGVVAAVKNGTYEFVVNARGKGNFEGVLASKTYDSAPVIQVIKSEDVPAGYLRLDKAKVVGKIPTFDFEMDDKGNAVAKSQELIKLFANGTLKLKVGSTVLEYKDSTVTPEKSGYYFSIEDPAEDDGDANRYAEGNNFIVLHPTYFDDPSVESMLIGDLYVNFTIKGKKLTVKKIAASIAYDGNPVLCYDDSGVAKKETLARLYKATKKAPTGSALVSDEKGAALPEDSYEIYALNDTIEVGTVSVVFEGNPQKGVTGKVVQKVAIAPKKLTLADKTASKKLEVNFLEDKNNVPYSKAGAKPAVAVSYGGEALTENVDYTVSYTSNTTPGKTGFVNLKFMGNYQGTVNKAESFTVGKANFSTDNIVAEAADKVYKAKAAKNYFKVKPVLNNDGKALKLKSDYVYVEEPKYYNASTGDELKDTDILPAGTTVKVVFTAKPKDGSKFFNAVAAPVEFATTYRIGENDISKVTVKVADQYYKNGRSVIPALTDITATDKKNKNNTVTFDVISITNNTKVGTATMIIKGTGKYCGTKKVTFKIKKSKS